MKDLLIYYNQYFTILDQESDSIAYLIKEAKERSVNVSSLGAWQRCIGGRCPLPPTQRLTKKKAIITNHSLHVGLSDVVMARKGK